MVMIRPQPGPQEAFLSSAADIVIYGGGAGGGKTFSLLLDPIRHLHNPRFSALIVRSSYPQIKMPGGLIDASMQLYPYLGGRFKIAALTWEFPSGAKIVFRHLRFDKDAHNFQGSEIPAILFDEATQISEYCWNYLASRNRSTCGIRPYIRASCNPDPEHHLRTLIDWWLGDDGFPIQERSGVLRHFERLDGQLVWFDHPTDHSRSLTFIPSRVTDNPALLQVNKDYLATLRSLPLIERERLLEGNWAIKPMAGKVFRTDWFKLLPPTPQPNLTRTLRSWDFASTRERQGTDPDATASVKLGLMQNGGVLILDVTVDHLTPAGVTTRLQAIAAADGPGTAIRWQRDPGQAGEYQNQHLRSLLTGYDAKGLTLNLSKLDRAGPLSRAAEFGEVYLLQAPWTHSFINELVSFPDGAHDDQVDAAAQGYMELTGVGVPRFGTAAFR